MIDQPTAEQALKELEVLIGDWTMEAIPPGGEPWPGGARATFEWLEGNQLMLERSDGGDAGGARRHLRDRLRRRQRHLLPALHGRPGVCRVYEMSIGDGEWKLWREGEPFAQRFNAKISDDGNRIEGRWEVAKDGSNWETDFDLVYTRVG